MDLILILVPVRQLYFRSPQVDLPYDDSCFGYHCGLRVRIHEKTNEVYVNIIFTDIRAILFHYCPGGLQAKTRRTPFISTTWLGASGLVQNGWLPWGGKRLIPLPGKKSFSTTIKVK